MKRILLLIVLIAAVVGSVYFYMQKTANTQQQSENGTEVTQAEEKGIDYDNLREKALIVPGQYMNGVFATQRNLRLPEDLEISVFASGFTEPRGLAFDNTGGVYFTDKGAGRIYYLADTNNDNAADQTEIVDEGLRNVHGIEFHEGSLYAAEEHQVVVYRGIQKASYAQKEILIAELPAGNELEGGGHVTRTIRIGPDKRIYLSIGSSCNVCEEDNDQRAAIVRYNIDGTDATVFARGLRNTVDFIFDDENKIWGVDNGRDQLGDNRPPEEVNLIQGGNHYGWPYCYGSKIANPEYIDRQEFCERATVSPVYEMQAHSAPLGLTFSPWDKNKNENMLIAFHGSWNRTVPTGYKLVRINTEVRAPAVADLITGWLQESGEAWGRPVDVKVYKDNKILITDDRAGAIYLVKEAQ